MKQAITILGKAGSGKSTVARAVAERLGWQYISTGEIARSLPYYGEWQALGFMAPEKQMRQAFEIAIEPHDMIVLDGMPRKPEQVDYLDQLFDEVYYYVISIDDEEAKRRLIVRGREDDTPIAIGQRLKDYHRITAKALAKARRRHQVTTIDGTLAIDEIVSYITYRFE